MTIKTILSAATMALLLSAGGALAQSAAPAKPAKAAAKTTATKTVTLAVTP